MTEAAEFWFARRFPVGDRRRAMAPVHWKGTALALIYVAVLMLGGFAFAWFGASGRMVTGVAIFAVSAIVCAGFFISVAEAKCDKQRTVADYRKARARV